jgi:hypothetical protein
MSFWGTHAAAATAGAAYREIVGCPSSEVDNSYWGDTANNWWKLYREPTVGHRFLVFKLVKNNNHGLRWRRRSIDARRDGQSYTEGWTVHDLQWIFPR